MSGSVAIGQIVVMLIGPKYRVAVAFQFPATAVDLPATIQVAEDLFKRRILLP
jgi:hypothetical protein